MLFAGHVPEGAEGSFFRNLNGTSQEEVALVTFLLPEFLMIRGLIFILYHQTKRSLPLPLPLISHLLLDFFVLILPFVISCTILSSLIPQLIMTLAFLSACVFFYIYHTQPPFYSSPKTIISTFLQSHVQFDKVPFWILSFTLETSGLKEFIIHNNDREKDFLHANKEGIFSVAGYVAIYLAGVQVGLYVMQPRSHASRTNWKKSWHVWWQFVGKYHSKLKQQDLNIALMVTTREVYSALFQLVPCVGCRRSVERLLSHLVESGNPALEPLTVKPTGMLSVTKACLADVKKLYTLFYIHGGSWMDVWELMSQECRDEVVLIDSACLLETLETYLLKRKGTVPLYEGLCCCPHERHIHVCCETDFIAHLLGRAEPEFAGGYERRERHAKTIDIAQEEVLTCLGIHLYERLHRIWQKLRAEEQTCRYCSIWY
ncbi:hypothetical protein INR49_026174 [Caranx melampygus]|nr:hypothetical protein INR49_026174 [Caranx melampygus]